MSKGHFGPELFKFLKGLKKNNNRPWFERNRPVFEEHVKAAALAFITDMQIPLELMAPRLVASPKATGGSLFRIYRDTRFAKDKTPYKTHIGIQFRHRAGKDAHAPGLYLHLEPGEVFLGGGIWHPDGPTLQKIRRKIAGHPDEWKKLTRAPAFKKRFSMEGEKLKRPPRGFDPEHPLIEDLKYKDFFVLRQMSEKDAVAPAFLPKCVKEYEKMTEYMGFLAEASGFSW